MVGTETKVKNTQVMSDFRVSFISHRVNFNGKSSMEGTPVTHDCSVSTTAIGCGPCMLSRQELRARWILCVFPQ